MKNLSILIIAFLSFVQLSFAQAPSYTNFEWDVARLGYVSPSGVDNIKGGITFGGELRYNLTDDNSIGLSTMYANFNVKERLRNETGKGASSLSLGIVDDYYFNTTSSKRAFIGLASGIQRFDEHLFDATGVTDVEETKLGFFLSPRVGYELSHLRILANYNWALKDGLPNYFSIGVALTLWGGYKG